MGSSKSFSIQAENRFSVARLHEARSGQVLPATELGGGGLSGRTLISRVIGPHPAGAWSRTSVTCHVPATGELVSANQKYGGPPWRSRDFATMLPSGATSENSAPSGFSAANMTRSGAPFHGTTCEGRTASSAAPSQAPAGAWALAFPAEPASSDKLAISDKAVVAATTNGRAGNTGAPSLSPSRPINIAKAG